MGQIFVHSKGYSIFYKVRHPFSPIPARIQCASFKKVTLTEQIRYKENLAKERWKKAFCDAITYLMMMMMQSKNAKSV